MEPPGLDGKLNRNPFGSTPIQLIRHPDLEKISSALEDTRIRRSSECKRLIFIEGDAGIGKSWFLGYVREHILNNHPQWQVLGPYDAEPFLNQSPYEQFVRFMNDCAGRPLRPIVQGQKFVEQDVLSHAEALEIELKNRKNEPLAIIFDELEWWVSVNEAQREALNKLFRIVWRVLLRQYSMPCIVICAGRRQPEFRDVLLKRTLYTFPLQGFPDNELEKLIDPMHSSQTRTAILHHANSNPWVTQLLNYVFGVNPACFNDPNTRIETLRWVFDRVVGNQLPKELRDLLYSLAQLRTHGFYEDDELLNGDILAPLKLTPTSFLDYDVENRIYRVAPVLISLFRE